MRRPDWTGRATALFQPWEKTVAIVAERPNTRRKRGRSAAFQLSAADVRSGSKCEILRLSLALPGIPESGHDRLRGLGIVTAHRLAGNVAQNSNADV